MSITTEERKAKHQERNQDWDAFLKAEGRAQCLACGYNGDISSIHQQHIEPPKLFNTGWFIASSPCTAENKMELRRELERCIALCTKCHHTYHSGRKGRAEVINAIQKRHVAMLAYAMFMANSRGKAVNYG